MVKLLDHVRGSDELDRILNEDEDNYGVESHNKLARLKLAIRCNEKQVGKFYFIKHGRVMLTMRLPKIIKHISQLHVSSIFLK